MNKALICCAFAAYCASIGYPGEICVVKRNHPTNQFLLEAFGPGDYLACGENGVCNGITIK